MSVYPAPHSAPNAAGRAPSSFGALSQIVSILPVKDIDAFPRLAAQGPRRVVEIDGRGLCARDKPEGSRVERLPVLGSDLELIARKGEAMTDKVAGGFAVVVRLGRDPGALKALLRVAGRLGGGERNSRGDDGAGAHR